MSRLSLVKSSPAESFTEPQTCQPHTKTSEADDQRTWSYVLCVVLTGKGSAPSWMTKPSMRCVRTFGLTTAWGGGALSPWLQTPRETASTGEGEEEAGGGAPEPGGEVRGRKERSNNCSAKNNSKRCVHELWRLKCLCCYLLRWDWSGVLRRDL